jgi:hypothetical protein
MRSVRARESRWRGRASSQRHRHRVQSRTRRWDAPEPRNWVSVLQVRRTRSPQARRRDWPLAAARTARAQQLALRRRQVLLQPARRSCLWSGVRVHARQAVSECVAMERENGRTEAWACGCMKVPCTLAMSAEQAGQAGQCGQSSLHTADTSRVAARAMSGWSGGRTEASEAGHVSTQGPRGPCVREEAPGSRGRQ